MFLRVIFSVMTLALVPFGVSATNSDQAGSASAHQQRTAEQTPMHQRDCEAGIADACDQVAFRHVMGAGGLAKDSTAAARFYQRACDLGSVSGCVSLGNAYKIGEGVPMDAVRSVQLFGKACEQGHSSGCLYTGDAYADGIGVAKDAVQAVDYFRKACVADKASLVCGYANDHMALMQDPVGHRSSRCDAGEQLECSELANAYEFGELGVSIDHARAAVAYGQACDLGSAVSCNILGSKYVRGEGVPQDFVRAVQLFQQVCNDKTVAGCVNLGAMYWNGTGTGVPRDTSRAQALNHQACVGGDTKGCDFMDRAAVAIMGTPEEQRARTAAEDREYKAQSAESLQRAVAVHMGDLTTHFEREARTVADADAMLARINSQAAAAQAQRTPQSAALAGRSQVVAHPVTDAVPVSPASVSYPSPQSASMTSAGSGPVEMFVFFINLGGKTVAFEGPLALSRSEGNAMKARLEGEAPGRYGAGATVDARSRGGGWCAFVYQRPGDERYIMGGETTLSAATNAMKGMVNNLNAVIHHDVVCP